MDGYITTNQGVVTYYNYPTYFVGPWNLPYYQVDPFEYFGHHFHYKGKEYTNKFYFPIP